MGCSLFFFILRGIVAIAILIVEPPKVFRHLTNYHVRASHLPVIGRIEGQFYNEVGRLLDRYFSKMKRTSLIEMQLKYLEEKELTYMETG